MERIDKVLIANRGEIACRIARTCRRLGLEVATVHALPDRSARHVREIGESVALERGYLDGEAVIAAARRVGANVIHPGYGFLSENPAFVRAVEAAGLVFVGPTAETMERLGGKAQAKREAARLGIPVVPGSDRGIDDVVEVANLVRGMRLPVLLKAVAGGGGRGMALIEGLDGLEARIESAMREAEQAFGSGELIVERYLPRVRHIEVQIAGDGQGQAIHLFERECTLQRRHQKIVEEAPSAGLPEQLRARLLEDAVRLARAVRYRGLGTVEFIVSGDEYFFLEVNPRLQVEHPVTEAITGLDLVEWQLRIADTGCLPREQDAVSAAGHALEVRLCAEDPAAGFLPMTGRLSVVDFSRTGVRVETGVETGDEISPHYDSMIAKLIAQAPTRNEVLQRMRVALSEVVVLGVPTNLAFLREVLRWPETRQGNFYTRLIDERLETIRRGGRDVPLAHLAGAALTWLQRQREEGAALGCWGWEALTGWRLALDRDEPAPQPALRLGLGANHWDVRFSRWDGRSSTVVAIGETLVSAAWQRQDEVRVLLQAEGLALEANRAQDEREIWLASTQRTDVLSAEPYLAGALTATAQDGQLLAPMLGKVVAVKAAPGDRVQAGQTLVVLESMKMELHVDAPFDGVLAELRCRPGEMVERHQRLGEVRPASAD